MPQQVWVFLNRSGESWAAADIARVLDMPLATVRGQLRRLVAAGKVTRSDGRYAGKVLYRRAD
jgi:DNA-binding IclR family transcriptional regulator